MRIRKHLKQMLATLLIAGLMIGTCSEAMAFEEEVLIEENDSLSLPSENIDEAALEEYREIEEADTAEESEIGEIEDSELADSDLEDSESALFPEGFEGIVDDCAVCSFEEEEDELYETAQMESDQNDSEQAETELEASGLDVALDITGNYYTLTAEAILGQINRIRKEACDQGIKYGGRKLTPEDYRPLKWSSALEEACRIRSMQAAITMAHKTLGHDSIYDYARLNLTEGSWLGMGENLAWNNEHDGSGITYGINQFYAEKDDYVNNTGGVTGHYTNMINPNFTHVAVASCMMNGAPYGWNTIAMQLGKASDPENFDQTKNKKTGNDTKSVPVATSYITSLSISGSKTIAVGSSRKCSGKAGFSYSNDYGNISGTYAVSNSEKYPLGWSCSDESVATVENALITGVGSGKATITARAGSRSAQLNVSVYEIFDSASLSLNRKNCELIVGESYKLNTVITPEDLMEKDSSLVISYFSDNEDVVTVDSNGKVTAKGEGEAVVTASLYSLDKSSKNKEAYCEFIVTESSISDTPYGSDDINGIWVAAESFEENLKYTGKKLKQDKLRIYYKKTLLKEKTDYSIAYKNNLNAADRTSEKRPQLIITLKGQYSGKKTYYFNIEPVDMQDLQVKVPGNVTVNKSSKPQKIVPEIYFNGKKLKAGTDFEADETMFSEVKSYDVNISGKGNFTGKRVVIVAVSDPEKNFCKAKASLTKKKVLFNGAALDLTEADFSVKLGGKVLEPELYEVIPDEIRTGTVKVTIAPTTKALSEGYNGFKSLSIKVSGDRNIKDAEVKGISDVTFERKKALSKEGMTLPGLTINYGEDVLVEGTDYTLKYSKNLKAGKATVTVTGIGRYQGSKNIKFNILPNDGRTEEYELTLVYRASVAYEKGGAQPWIKVRDNNGFYLEKGRDYSVSIKNRSNLNPGIMTCLVIGKGNYKGYISDELSITIKNADLSSAVITTSDKAYSKSNTAWKSAIKIKDKNGKALQAGKDYSTKLEYFFDGMQDNPVPKAGTVVYVTATGAGNYDGSFITGSYRIYSQSISKLTIKVDKMTYTGKEIEPTYENIHIYASSSDAKKQINELIPASDYVKITGYSSNIKSGKGKITLRGIGNYGGSKTISFDISKKSF